MARYKRLRPQNEFIGKAIGVTGKHLPSFNALVATQEQGPVTMLLASGIPALTGSETCGLLREQAWDQVVALTIQARQPCRTVAD